MALGSLPRYRPQLATLVREPPEGDKWCHELKYDGYRMGLLVDGGRVRVESRRELDWTARFPELSAAARALGVESAVVDGEAAILQRDGRTNFQLLQSSFEGGPRTGFVYYAFDLLALNGRDLMGEPLHARKRMLEQLLLNAGVASTTSATSAASVTSAATSVLRYSQHVVGNGQAVFAGAQRLGAEGIVSKLLDGRYLAGRREGWRKTKCTTREDFVIGGFTEPEGSRAGIGALLLGLVNEEGELVFAGKVGTGPGFTAEYLSAVRSGLATIEQTDCPFVKRPPRAIVGPQPHWVKPVLVGTVEYVERTDDGHVRHPSFLGFRK